MKSISRLLVGSLLALSAEAFPNQALQAPAGHEYSAPSGSDVRSPCPGLNSLANHGWINRSGRNITVPQLIAGGLPGIGIGPDFMGAIGALALFSPDKPNFVSFDLDDLAEHNFPIEHDVSLTREDYYFNQDDITFQRPLYDDFISYFKGQEMTSLKASSDVRYARVRNSLKNNPDVTYGPMQFAFSYGESGLYTQTMGSSPLAQTAPVKYVESLFLHERLPYELGWKPSVIPINLLSLGNFATEIFLLNKEAIPLGAYILTKGFYKEAVTTFLALQGKLHNISATQLSQGVVDLGNVDLGLLNKLKNN